MELNIRTTVEKSIAVKKQLLTDELLLEQTQSVIEACITCFQNEGKILFCGNGGSAADAQHLAAEFSGRFYIDREPLFAEALHVNTSFLTAVANDYSFDEVYARMVRAMGQEGDILFAMSTSGNSPNVLRAAQDAQYIGMQVVAMTGQTGGKLKEHCDWLLNMPSADTPRIQECHMLLGHIICEQVEAHLFKSNK
jgi:D-sedoheptulose 7-phosphate isomerase